MSPRRQRRDPNTSTVVRIPNQALHERVLDLAAPLTERLGAGLAPEAVRGAVEVAITFWNAKARASKIWGTARTKQLNDLQRKMTGKKATAEDGEAFKLLSERWRDKELAFDPRLVGEVICTGYSGHHDVAVLVFKPAPSAARQ